MGNRAAAGVAVAAGLLLAGCGASGAKVITRHDLEAAVSARLTDEGHDHDGVRCDGDLRAEPARTTRCVMTAGDHGYRVAVVVTSVDGDAARYDVEVDAKPLSRAEGTELETP